MQVAPRRHRTEALGPIYGDEACSGGSIFCNAHSAICLGSCAVMGSHVVRLPPQVASLRGLLLLTRMSSLLMVCSCHSGMRTQLCRWPHNYIRPCIA